MSDADRRGNAPGCVRHWRRNRGDAQIVLAFVFGEALAMNSAQPSEARIWNVGDKVSILAPRPAQWFAGDHCNPDTGSLWRRAAPHLERAGPALLALLHRLRDQRSRHSADRQTRQVRLKRLAPLELHTALNFDSAIAIALFYYLPKLCKI
jgi:hypothetical protein